MKDSNMIIYDLFGAPLFKTFIMLKVANLDFAFEQAFWDYLTDHSFLCLKAWAGEQAKGRTEYNVYI